MLARVLIAQDRPDQHSACWAGCPRPGQAAQGRTASVIEIAALQALALAAAGDDAAAAEALARALTLAARKAMSGCSPTRARR